MILNRQFFTYHDRTLVEKVTIKPPFRYEAIFQNEGCFIYVTGGNSKVHSANGSLELKAEETVLFKCGSYFVDWLKNTNEAEITVIAFHLYPEVLKKLYQDEIPKLFSQVQSGFAAQKIIPEDTISKFIENLDFYFQNPVLVNDDLLELKIKELVLLLIQTKNATSVTSLISDLFTPQTVNLRNLIEENRYENLSISELAKLSNRSLSSFKLAFMEVFKDTPRRYMTVQKLNKAKGLLVLPHLSIAEIAHQVGYNDSAYFTRIFKKEFGLTPKNYRDEV